MFYNLLDPSTLRAVTSSKIRLVGALICFIFFTATSISPNRALLDASANELEPEEATVQSFADRHNCQIIYILGVEGAAHHGFTPVLEKLARRQVDTATDDPYVVTYPSKELRSALFGWGKETRTLDNPTLARQVIRKICPRNLRKHVIIEDSSFPAGFADDPRTYRIYRQSWWLDSSMEEIAMSETALNHPTNLYTFYKAFSHYADIKFVVLHRSYIETVASHNYVDDTTEGHSNVIRGFMLLLRRFLDTHAVDEITGRRLWTLVCVERLMMKFYGGEDDQMNFSRQNILTYLANFLGWPETECPDCFATWVEGEKNYMQTLGETNVAIVLEQMRKLGGIWPPTVWNPLPEQKCSL